MFCQFYASNCDAYIELNECIVMIYPCNNLEDLIRRNSFSLLRSNPVSFIWLRMRFRLYVFQYWSQTNVAPCWLWLLQQFGSLNLLKLYCPQGLWFGSILFCVTACYNCKYKPECYMYGCWLMKVIGCSSLRGGVGELGTLKILTYGSN